MKKIKATVSVLLALLIAVSAATFVSAADYKTKKYSITVPDSYEHDGDDGIDGWYREDGTNIMIMTMDNDEHAKVEDFKSEIGSLFESIKDEVADGIEDTGMTVKFTDTSYSLTTLNGSKALKLYLAYTLTDTETKETANLVQTMYVLTSYSDVFMIYGTCATNKNKDAVELEKAISTFKIIDPAAKLNKTSVTLGVGESYTLKASGQSPYKWSTSSKSVATVSGGKVTAKKSGTATVTVTAANGKKATCKVTVKAAPKSIKLNKTSITLGVGESYTLKATLPSGTASNTRSWSTSNKGIVTVSGGKITAKKSGTANITVKTFNGKKATCKVTVKAAPKSVKLNKTGITLGVGENYTLKATLPSGTASNIKSWSTSNKGIVTVSGGKITAKKAGTANITVKTFNGKTATCKVTVKAAPKSIKLDKKSVTVKKGKTCTLKATLPSGTASNIKSWSTSNKNIATVSGGKITGKKAGTATITVKTFNGKKATCKVTVKK